MRNVEGYWWSKDQPDYPKPVPDVLTQEEADSICSLIKKQEKFALKIKYRGWSPSRLEEGVRLGSAEFQTREWKWPDSLAEYYVKKFRVKPSDEFLEYIGYN